MSTYSYLSSAQDKIDFTSLRMYLTIHKPKIKCKCNEIYF